MIDKWIIFKQTCKAAMFILLLFGSFIIGDVYSNHINYYPDDGLKDFVFEKKTFEGGGTPEFVKEQDNKFNNFKNVTYMFLIFYVGFEVASYKINPQKHFFSTFKEVINKNGEE